LHLWETYAAANETIIWLGKNTTDLDDVLTLCDLDIVAKPGAEEPRYPQYKKALMEKSEKFWRDVWSGFLRFFERRRYFYRASVFQKCAL